VRERRTESDVLAQIRNWAESRDVIRAVILTSSRADPRRTPDILSDYDLEVYVADIEPFVQDDSWLTEFGSIMVRWPSRPQPTVSDDWITQLVLFEDGVRIDFQITTRKQIDSAELDGGYRIVVDKDKLAAQLPPPTYARSGVTRPTAEAYESRLSAFWWDIIYVAKGLWRGELNYAKCLLDGTIRFDKLQPLIAWYIGVHHGWSVDVGIHGRWFHRYLDEPTWEHYQQTFADASIENNWQALFATLAFVRHVGKHVAKALGFAYPDEVDAKVTRYIQEIKQLDEKRLDTA
jgi:aminoglycoside 6-adenylyltransferase